MFYTVSRVTAIKEVKLKDFDRKDDATSAANEMAENDKGSCYSVSDSEGNILDDFIKETQE